MEPSASVAVTIGDHRASSCRTQQGKPTRRRRRSLVNRTHGRALYWYKLHATPGIKDSIPDVLQPPSLSGQVVGCEPAVLQDVASVTGPGGPLDMSDAMGETWLRQPTIGGRGAAHEHTRSAPGGAITHTHTHCFFCDRALVRGCHSHSDCASLMRRRSHCYPMRRRYCGCRLAPSPPPQLPSPSPAGPAPPGACYCVWAKCGFLFRAVA